MGGPALKNAGGALSKKTTLYSRGGIGNNTCSELRAYMGMRAKTLLALKIGRASCRGRGEISVGAGSLKKKRGHTRCSRDWSSAVCSSDLPRRHRKQYV